MRWLLFALIAAAVAGIVFLPLRLVAGRLVPGLAADSMSGSVWDGRMRNASYGGIALGDVDMGLDARALLAGKARLDFQRMGPALSGRIGGSRQVRSVDELNGAVQLALLPPPVPGVALEFAAASARFDVAQGCTAAGGRVAATVTGIPGVGNSPLLSGTLRCDGDALHAPLRTVSGDYGLSLWLWQDGRYKAGLKVVTENPLLRITLAGAGFTRVEGGLFREITGNARNSGVAG